MTGLWTPSDALLLADPIAAAKVENPHPPPDLAGAGIILPGRDLDDDAIEAAAASVLAELDGDDVEPEEDGHVDDDEAEDDLDDRAPVDPDV